MQPRFRTLALAILTAILLTPGTLALLDAGPPEPDRPNAPTLDDVLAVLPAEESDEEAEEDETSEPETDEEAEERRTIEEETVQDAERTVEEVGQTVQDSIQGAEGLLAPEEDEAQGETPREDAPAATPSSPAPAEAVGSGLGSEYLAAGATAAVIVTTLTAIKHGIWTRFLAPAFAPLFSRFEGPTVLEHPRRAKLHGLVCRTPGITVPQLCDATGLSRNTVLHHLRMLGDQDMVVQQRQGRTAHWFENGGRYGREHKAAYAVLHDSRSKDVAQYIRTHPGSTQGQVSRSLGLAPSVVHWHMKRLEDADLVQRRRDGRTMQCFPGTHLESLTS